MSIMAVIKLLFWVHKQRTLIEKCVFFVFRRFAKVNNTIKIYLCATILIHICATKLPNFGHKLQLPKFKKVFDTQWIQNARFEFYLIGEIRTKAVLVIFQSRLKHTSQ